MKNNSKFGLQIPELKELISKYGSSLNKDKPPFVIVGQISTATGPVRGILATAQNEIYANIICREVNKMGDAKVHRSEHHQNPTFSISAYKDSIRASMIKQALAEEQAKVTEQPVEAPKFKLRIVK